MMEKRLKPWGGFLVFLILSFFALNQVLFSQEAKISGGLKALLPEFSGWEFQEEPQIYVPGTLFEYINGASEAYLSYDFKELVVGNYQKKGSETTLTLEIYDMGTSLNAFGIFSSERFPESPEAGIGLAGYLEEEVLNFVAGPYYVKLICYNGQENTPQYLKLFGAEVEKRIKDKGSLPDLFKCFPAEGRVKNSEKYIKKDFMGFNFLKNGYAVTYRLAGAEFDGFIIEAASVSEASNLLQKIIDYYSGEKAPFRNEGKFYHQINIYGQHVFLAQVNKFLYGFSRVPEDLVPVALKNFDLLGQALKKI
ncbi:MAG: hypothetical protein H5U07_09565 [Candidatus Aminicenantes bacterium]|nr:hypothetical protein [Candidatus Aminicenantes bacterium]